LSLKRYELWIVIYAITPKGRAALRKAMPNFPMCNLISVLPEAELSRFLTPDLRTLCTNYAELIDMKSSGLGYRGSACPIVFEHGCPNNLPVILWANSKNWKGLFPNRSIPSDMRNSFDEDGINRGIEALWQANQPKLALSLLDSLDHVAPMSSEHRMLLTMLGLRLRGVAEVDLAARLLMSAEESTKLLDMAVAMDIYDKAATHLTPLGKALVSRFRERFNRARPQRAVASDPDTYYPSQCEGNTRELGITDRGNGRSVPMEPQ
jgi:hypothetical protein